MAALAQALVVFRIDKQFPISPVRLDVVHHGGPGPDAAAGAFLAPRLPQELGRAQIAVQMSRLYHPWYSAEDRRSARLGLCLSQYPSRVSAGHPGYRQGRSGFIAMGYHLQAYKKPEPNTTHSWVSCRAPAFNALASCNIHDDLCFAIPAVNRESGCLGFFIYPQQPFIPVTGRAGYPSVPYD